MIMSIICIENILGPMHLECQTIFAIGTTYTAQKGPVLLRQ